METGPEDTGLPLYDGCDFSGCAAGQGFAWPSHRPARARPAGHQLRSRAVVRGSGRRDCNQGVDPGSRVRIFGTARQAGSMTPRKLLARWLARQLAADAEAWLDKSTAQ